MRRRKIRTACFSSVLGYNSVKANKITMSPPGEITRLIADWQRGDALRARADRPGAHGRPGGIGGTHGVGGNAVLPVDSGALVRPPARRALDGDARGRQRLGAVL